MSDINLRTLHGVETLVREWHTTLCDAADTSALVARVYLMVTCDPATEERYAQPRLFRLDYAPTIPLSKVIELTGHEALARRAVGAALCMPVLTIDPDSEDVEGAVTFTDSSLAMAFAVEHMTAEVGRRVWTAAVAIEGESVAKVGNLTERKEGFMWGGMLRGATLLPQTQMN